MKAENDIPRERESPTDSDDTDRPRRSYEKPLKIRGSLDDALRVIVGKPKTEDYQNG